MVETPTTREELVELIYWNSDAGSRDDGARILDALSAAGLAVVPREPAASELVVTEACEALYRSMVAAADLLRGGR